MAAGGFSSPGCSSSGTAAEVEALIAEAADLVALEQIAKLNTAHLADDALLPADVESRFRRLKTFPASSEKRGTLTAPRRQAYDKGLRAPSPTADAEHPPPASLEAAKIPKSNRPVDKDVIFTAATTSPVKSGGANVSEGRSRNGLLPSPSIAPPAASSSQSRDGSPSPPRGRGCCFALSPRKSDSGKKAARDRGGMKGVGKEGDYGLFSDQGTFSLSEQSRSLRKAKREEEKVAREAQRMVKWMKQASARMEVSAATVEELLSDLEDEGKSK